ncbi:GDSL esterase/lipase [Acorus calamus]|uniref:GDSL esterase/lipase n=1 Tax=Acorus calamus TaxID=4465 RepID=A0AAV9F161_ACOCL|nr:GDSL esterase/lipase [Acorus calamus]
MASFVGTHFLAISAVLSMVLSLSSAVDFNYPAAFNFGDSNSDTGGLIAGLGVELNPPNGKTYFKKPSGRFCNGRLIVDFLSKSRSLYVLLQDLFFWLVDSENLRFGVVDAMDLPFLNSYLDSIGRPNFRRGCNFAAAGSTVLPATASAVSPFSFGVQVAQFFRFKERVLELLANKGHKLDKYIPAEDFFNQGLYMFDIGQNDLAVAFYSKTEVQVVASIPTILLEFETGIKKLYDQGARRFWIHNTGPLGCLPQNIAVFGKDPSKLDELGCDSKVPPQCAVDMEVHH